MIFNNTKDQHQKDILTQRLEELEMFKQLCCHSIDRSNMKNVNIDFLQKDKNELNEILMENGGEFDMMVQDEENNDLLHLMDSVSFSQNNGLDLKIFEHPSFSLAQFPDIVKTCILNTSRFFSIKESTCPKSTNVVDDSFLLYKSCNNLIENLYKNSNSENMTNNPFLLLHLINPKHFEENKLSKLFDDNYSEIQDVISKLSDVFNSSACFIFV